MWNCFSPPKKKKKSVLSLITFSPNGFGFVKVIMADPEAEARADLEDGVVEAPQTGGGESEVPHEQVGVWSSITIFIHMN